MQKTSQLINIVKYIYFISGLNPFKLYNSLVEFFIYYSKRKFSPEEILLYNMLSKHNNGKYKQNIYSNEEYLAVQKKLNPKSSIQMTESKTHFYKLCQEKNIPTPKTFFHIEKISLSSTIEQVKRNIKAQLNTLPDGDFIVKPSLGTHGKGIFFFSKRASSFKMINEETLALDAFTQYLSTLCHSDEYLIQARMTNHKNISAFAPSEALQTLRINSLIVDEDCSILFCEFKQAGQGQLVDNFCMGQNNSTSWIVDLKTGQLIRGYQVNENGYGYKELDINTISQARNIYLPLWPETVELVRDAAKKFLPLKTVGWDVAITDEGPLIIEGNCFFDSASAIRDYDKRDIYQQLKKQVQAHV